jgi:NAD(P)-dependent dehydrogenase (short-subunit alcohol dehydrogenase family)
VVAGAGPGIGSAVAKKFAAEGFQVTGATPIIRKEIGALFRIFITKIKIQGCGSA